MDDDIATRFTAMKGTAAPHFLERRAEFMHIVGLLAGKWPHTLAIQPGGSTRVVIPSEVQRLHAILTSFRRFWQQHVFGVPIEAFSAIQALDGLHDWADSTASRGSGLSRFLHVNRSLGLSKLGRATDRFLSFGTYRNGDGHLFECGLMNGNEPQRLNTGLITEDIATAWMHGQETPLHPYDGETTPDGDMRDGYTWCKAPRLEGQVVEVGALAQQIVARFIEVALLVPAMERWLREIQPDDVFIQHAPTPDHADGAGLTEAERLGIGCAFVKVRFSTTRSSRQPHGAFRREIRPDCRAH